MLDRLSGVPHGDDPAPDSGPLERLKLPLTLVLVAVAAVGAGVWLGGQPRSQPVALPTIAGGVLAPRLLKVHVAGAVARPGLYDLADGDRIADAIEHAGGAATDADLARLNLAQRLRDGQQVIVPAAVSATGPSGLASLAPASAGTAATPTTSTPSARPRAPTRDEPLNLNLATSAELEALPGIGPVTAGRILAHREQQGPFGSLDDFHRARLVNNPTWERIKDVVAAP